MRALIASDLIRYFTAALILGAAATAGVGALITANDAVGGDTIAEAEARGRREGERLGLTQGAADGRVDGLRDGAAEGARLARESDRATGFEVGYAHAWRDTLTRAIDEARRSGLGLVDAIPEWRQLLDAGDAAGD